MIKFWKSAAKGKSGCPVRPPEQSSATSNNTDVNSLLDIQEKDKEYSCTFEKKSRLSLNLHDIFVERRALKHFVHFMESIAKQNLTKCWLELENFRIAIRDTNDAIENHSKLSRAKSFDLQCKCSPQPSHRLSWNDEASSLPHNTTDSELNKKNECSTNSYGNLSEHTEHNSEHCEIKNVVNPTEEAISLFKKYVALEAPYQLDLPDKLRKSVISNICDPEGHIKEDCFKPVQEVVFNQIENNYFHSFINSPFYIKAQIDILTSISLNLEDILYNDSILFYFTEYLEQESCSILLEFIIAIDNFRDNLINGNSVNAEQAQSDAIILYDKYFSLQATNSVGFPTDIRLQIESDICREEGPLPTCFDLPYQIVFKTLSRYVKKFLDSELYYKYLSEMIHSVEQTFSNNKSHSDCSSEFSISTQNTLLAMGDPVFRKKKRNYSVPDMTIDSNQLYNADALWQRKKNEGLSLGRVNSLGRFESKFEPDPDKKDKSVLKKMVSKFVPTHPSTAEEEMAWQIAHMIVKDVTDLTMAPPDNEDV